MKRANKPSPQQPHGNRPCQPKRLATSAFASVDGCVCGNMLLHIGPFTLRMDRKAVAALLATLGQAVARQNAIAEAEKSKAGVPILMNKGGSA